MLHNRDDILKQRMRQDREIQLKNFLRLLLCLSFCDIYVLRDLRNYEIFFALLAECTHRSGKLL